MDTIIRPCGLDHLALPWARTRPAYWPLFRLVSAQLLFPSCYGYRAHCINASTEYSTLIAHAERNQVGLATYTQSNCTDGSLWPTISFRRPVWNTVRQKRKHGNMAQNHVWHIPVMLLSWPLAAGFDMCFPHRGATVRHLQAHQLPIQDQFNSAMTRIAPSIL